MATKRSVDVKIEVKRPSKYKVVLLNNDVTPFEFVIGVISYVFNKNYNDAYALTMKIHENGKAVCGVYSKDIATTKVSEVTKLANSYGYPLECILEEE